MDLIDIAQNILRDCMGAKQGEEVLIVTDDRRVNIAQALDKVSVDLCCEAVIL